MLFKSKTETPYDNDQQLRDAKNLLLTIQPVVKKVYSNKAVLMMSKGFDWIEEYLYYIFALVCFVFMFIMNSVFPFHVLGEIVENPTTRAHFSNPGDIQNFNLAVKALVCFIGLLFIFLGIKKNVIRKNKTLLYEASKELKNIEIYLMNKVNTLSKLPTVSETNAQIVIEENTNTHLPSSTEI